MQKSVRTFKAVIDKLLQADHETYLSENPEISVVERGLCFHELYLQESYWVLMGNITANSCLGYNRKREEVIILKYIQAFIFFTNA